MENNQKQKIVVLIHGFKKRGYDDFCNLYEYAEGKTKYPIKKAEDWYDNHDKSTLSWRSMKNKIDSFLDKYKDKEVILIGYSMGAVASFRLAAKNNNVKSFMAMYPAFYINFKGWIKVLFKNVKKWRKMKKTLGKERYKRMKMLKSRGVAEIYPITIALNINIFRKKQIKYLSKLKGKNILLVWSQNDEFTQNAKVKKILDEKLDTIKNKLTLLEANESHFNALNKGQYAMFDRIITFINAQ